MNRIARRVYAVILLIVMLLGGLGYFLYEYVNYAETWVVSPGSPHVYNSTNIGCGTVVDRSGVALLDLTSSRVYASDASVRKAFIHWLGDRSGNISAPAVSHYAKELTGYNVLDGLYSYSGSGGEAVLTLSADAQLAALQAMGSYKGTIAVYNYKTGEILCAVTAPNYDPDHVPEIVEGDETYEGVYLNRFTQSTYPPGSIFKLVTAAAALDTIDDIQDQTFTCSGTVQYGPDKVTCENTHGKQSLKDALRNSCNCAFAQIAGQLGGETLQKYAEKFGITGKISFDGITTAAGSYAGKNAAEVDLAWSAIGQYTDMINPCQYMTFMGAIAGGGQGAVPHIVSSVSANGEETYTAKTQMGSRIMSASVAATLTEYMRNNVVNKYGSNNFPGLTVCAKSGTSQLGGDEISNAMFAGFVADEEYPLAFIVVVENGGYGASTCVPILSKVLAACKSVLDGE